ncbi:MAG: hypothetical protein FWF52_05655 [Candidatus Azobacteroides sp.]|nr:hypothetical protein [Candidatus Azobacteroides sp.]
MAEQVIAQTPQELQAALPAVEGWSISSDIEIFNRDNLYERIDGAAPLFLENNFQEMTSMEYDRGDDYITIQAYRHATPEDAFGMYASERSADMNFYDGIGGEAQGDDSGLYFFAGNIYVKINASIEGDTIRLIMQEIARGLAEKIDPQANYPALFRSFPTENLVPHSESYITQNYIGHQFLKPAYTAAYNLDGKTVQAFVIDGQTPEGAKQILQDYLNFTKQEADFSGERFLIQDRYNGNIPLLWKGRYLIGVFNDKGEDFSEDIYSFLNKFDC